MSSNFTILEATYRIVTPMFCGGADPAEPELRLPSIKGALRFWWRTLQWGRITDPVHLLETESRIFGSSDQAIGRSKVQMRLIDFKPEQILAKGSVLESGKLAGVHYLGYGLMGAFGKDQGKLERGAISGGTFRLGFRCGPGLSVEEIDSVKAALILLGTVGGIGSRVRRGFGSLTLTDLEQDSKTIELSNSFEVRINELLPTLSSKQAEWTAWGEASRVVAATSGDRKPLALLNRLGKEMMYYRSWGHRGRVLDRTREENFKEDHDLSKVSDGVTHPKRVVFGLPHNYGRGANQSVTPDGREYDRRASPLFFHIHQPSPKDLPVAIVILLPSKFLPDGTGIRTFGDSVKLDRSDDFWRPAHEYLDRLQGLQKRGARPRVESLNAEELKIGQ